MNHGRRMSSEALNDKFESEVSKLFESEVSKFFESEVSKVNCLRPAEEYASISTSLYTAVFTGSD